MLKKFTRFSHGFHILFTGLLPVVRVLFVLPMYEELQPGQVNSYTTFDLLSGGVLSLVFVKKHNFV